MLIYLFALFCFAKEAHLFSIKRDCFAWNDETKNWLKAPDGLSGKPVPNFFQLFKETREVFGRGAHGVTKKIQISKTPEIIVAVKRLPIDDIDELELQILMDMSGQGTSPELFACQKCSDYVYIVQEILAKKLDQEGYSGTNPVVLELKNKRPRELFLFLKTLFENLLLLFRNKYLHGDIKPENIMANKELSKIYLIDFGLSEKEIIFFDKNENSFRGFYKQPGSPVYTSLFKRIRSWGTHFDDLYAAALTAAEILSSFGAIFNAVRKQCSTKKCTMFMCDEQDGKTTFYPFKSPAELHNFCVENLKENVIWAAKPFFGDVVPVSNDSGINFTTLLAELIDYEKYEQSGSPLTLEWVESTLESIAKKYEDEEHRITSDAKIQISLNKLEAKDETQTSVFLPSVKNFEEGLNIEADILPVKLTNTEKEEIDYDRISEEAAKAHDRRREQFAFRGNKQKNNPPGETEVNIYSGKKETKKDEPEEENEEFNETFEFSRNLSPLERVDWNPLDDIEFDQGIAPDQSFLSNNDSILNDFDKAKYLPSKNFGYEKKQNQALDKLNENNLYNREQKNLAGENLNPSRQQAAQTHQLNAEIDEIVQDILSKRNQQKDAYVKPDQKIGLEKYQKERQKLEAELLKRKLNKFPSNKENAGNLAKAKIGQPKKNNMKKKVLI